MNFSRIKNNKIPDMNDKETDNVKPVVSATSGIRWIKLSPSSAPAAKLTNMSNNFLSVLIFIGIVIIPINEITLTINILIKV